MHHLSEVVMKHVNIFHFNSLFIGFFFFFGKVPMSHVQDAIRRINSISGKENLAGTKQDFGRDDIQISIYHPSNKNIHPHDPSPAADVTTSITLP